MGWGEPHAPFGGSGTKPLSAAPKKLRLLADWFDVTGPAGTDDEVQSDLRHWADLIEQLGAR